MKYAYRLEGGFVTKNEVVSETESTITFRPDPKTPNYILKERKITNDHQWFDDQKDAYEAALEDAGFKFNFHKSKMNLYKGQVNYLKEQLKK